jgi:hypothetical protein
VGQADAGRRIIGTISGREDQCEAVEKTSRRVPL